MDEEEADTCSVNKGEKRVVQDFGDKVRDGLHLGFLDKVEICQMDEDENKNSHTSVGHGLGAKRTSTGTGFNRIFAASGFAIFQKQDNAGDDMQEENRIQANFKNWYKNA